MRAQADCGLGHGDDLRDAIEIKFKIEKWPQSNGDYIFRCMMNNHPNSYSNIVKSLAFSRVITILVPILIFVNYIQ